MSGDVRIREATAAHLAEVVALLADDPLGADREDPSAPLAASYQRAFASIDADPHNRVLIAVAPAWPGRDDGGAAERVVATLQLTLIPNLTYRGGWRAQIEGVRVAADRWGGGLGRRLVEAAVDHARKAGCRLVQLTTDASRDDARAFYAALGFEASHVGMKLHLDPDRPA